MERLIKTLEALAEHLEGPVIGSGSILEGRSARRYACRLSRLHGQLERSLVDEFPHV